MAKMRKEQLQKIVEREMPGYRLARTAKATRQESADARARRDRPAAEARTPSLDTLRKKYLKNDRAADAARVRGQRQAGARRAGAAAGDDDEIVAVEPESPAHAWDRAARPKAVVVSGKDKRIVGKQG